MKLNFGWLNDVSFQLIALTTTLAGAAIVYNARSGWSAPPPKGSHPVGCHACSVCDREAVAARDAFLIRTGSIIPPDSSE
jgi:hypothetical protein